MQTGTWIEVALAALNAFQVVALAWIAAKYRNGRKPPDV